ncbi:MAG: hypothetical protein LCH67_19515 [Bacteroidetes bacterium]|nr:hypothetical protein [Bacteroidota bacterium]
MKIIKKASFFTFAFVALISCRKAELEDNSLAALNTAVSAEEASTMIQYAISSETAGLSTLVTDLSSLTKIKNTPSYCGKSKDSTVTKSKSSASSLHSYSYSMNWSWILNCSTTKVPSSFTNKSSFSGQYKTPKVISSDNGESNMTIAGLDAQSTNYKYTGSYVKNGTQSLSIVQAKDVTSTITLNITDIQVSKSTLKIQSGGKASVVIEGKSSTGKTFSYTGTIVFNGNGSATININGSKEYNVQI